MDNTTRARETVPNSTHLTDPRQPQVVRAWILLILGFAVFVTLLVFAGTTAYSYVLAGTQSRTATLEAVSGQSLFLRSPGERDWRLVTERTTVAEGDTISTGGATAGWITLFDQGTIEVSENSMVRINQMRTSRLFREQKIVEIEPVRGSVYVGMAPRGDFNSSIMQVDSGPVSVRMRDEIRTEQTGSFLVEAQRTNRSGGEDDPLLSVRVAVLRGAASVETDHHSRTLVANEQVVIDSAGNHGDVTPAMRELVRNGDFSRHLADWVEYQDNGGEATADFGTVARVSVDLDDDGQGVALQIRRSSNSGNNWETGVQQTIQQSLRVHSSLNLSMTLRIDEQRPIGGGDLHTEFPLIVKMTYVDLHGQDREWWHGFYILDDARSPVPEERATRLDRGEWESVSLDLRNLAPLPRQITSLIVYSSGHSYRALVTDISLTSSETGEDEYD